MKSTFTGRKHLWSHPQTQKVTETDMHMLSGCPEVHEGELMGVLSRSS